jgi:hypothetical protein
MDIPTWGWVLIALAGLFTAPYWLGPILIHGSQKLSANPQFQTVAAESDLPPDVSEFFIDMREQFTRIGGFVPVVQLAQEGFVNNVRSYLELHRNAATGHSAIALAAYARMKTPEGVQWKLKSSYVQFSTAYTDEGATMTSNSKNAEVFAPIQGKKHFKFETGDVSKLYAAHHKLEAVYGRGRTRKTPPPDPAKYMSESMVKELTQQIGTGYLYREDDYFRPTWKGAVCMVYKSLPPLKGRLRAKELRESQQALDSAGTHG